MRQKDALDMDQPPIDSLSPEETAKRRDDALRRALNTPPQPKQRKDTESNPAKGRALSAKRGRRGQSAEMS